MTDANPARTVLVVDDDRDLRELVADIVESSGRRVFIASDGADALRQLHGDGIPRPCIVLLDWLMAPMGGHAFLGALAQRPDAADFRVLLVSASRTAPPPDLPWKVFGVLRKPFGVDELLTLLDGHG